MRTAGRFYDKLFFLSNVGRSGWHIIGLALVVFTLSRYFFDVELTMNNKRIPTGIPELDRLIEGGLRMGKSYLVIGEPGTGKTVFALQFLVNGLMNKEKGLYVAVDEKPADVMEQAKSLGWDLAPFIDSKDFLILDASAYFGGRAAEGQARSIDVQRVVTDLSNYITRLGASRVVIDPVGPLLFSRESMSRVLDQTRVLFYALQANAGTTNLLTTYAVERKIRGIEEYLVSGTFFLEMELINRRFVRTVTIEKMRSTALAPGQYLFDILADRGIVLRDAAGIDP